LIKDQKMAKFGIGQAVRRVEDARFLTGQGRYVDDIVLPGLAHGAVLHSPHAHARLKSIDTSKVKAAPGVLRRLTGADAAADNFYTLYTSSQNPHGVREEMAGLLHVNENQLRVVAPDVGGGFGLKGGSFPDDVLVLWASKKLRRPVKWVATRSESMMTDHTGRDLISHGEIALDEEGKSLAIRSQSLFQIGAYFVGPGMVSGLFSLRFIPEA